jgi:hypothetical protein
MNATQATLQPDWVRNKITAGPKTRGTKDNMINRQTTERGGAKPSGCLYNSLST